MTIIGRAITLYDSKWISDSVDFVQPPSDVYYDWKMMAGNGCDSIQSDGNKGVVRFLFRCAGTYLLTAGIYDSVTHSLTGVTDAVAVTVTADTLPS